MCWKSNPRFLTAEPMMILPLSIEQCLLKTSYSVLESLIKFAKNVNLFIHNVAAARAEDLRHSERLQNIMGLHLSPEEARKVFTRSKPKLAVYTHMVLFSINIEEIVTRTRHTYSGPLEIGKDLMVFEVGDTIKVRRP